MASVESTDASPPPKKKTENKKIYLKVLKRIIVLFLVSLFHFIIIQKLVTIALRFSPALPAHCHAILNVFPPRFVLSPHKNKQ